MIILDGSKGEGGGQIVRTALALSNITGKPFRVTNIRAGRKDAGLKPQHVHCVKALQQLCGAKSEGAFEGSSELLYVPGKITAKNLTIDIGTAGSITLLLQAVLLPCMFAKKSHMLRLKGGTDTEWSMPADYFANVLLPQYRRVCDITSNLLKRGYYPKGGGEVKLAIKPKIHRNEYENFEAFWKELSKHSFKLEDQGTLIGIKGISHASKDLLNARVAERQAEAAKQKLSKFPTRISVEYADTLSTGSGITLWAVFSKDGEDIDIANPIRIGADALGAPGKPAELVGQEAAEKLLKSIASKAPVDSHLADNLIPLLALCAPSSMLVEEITKHAHTNIDVVEAFLGKVFKIEGNLITTKRV